MLLYHEGAENQIFYLAFSVNLNNYLNKDTIFLFRINFLN